MPGSFKSNATYGIPSVARSMPTVRHYQTGNMPFFMYGYTLAGVTRDSAGTALGSCTVEVFRTGDNSVAARTVSDVSGNYSIPASSELSHYVVAYLPGSPDVAGTTTDTLVGT